MGVALVVTVDKESLLSEELVSITRVPCRRPLGGRVSLGKPY